MPLDYSFSDVVNAGVAAALDEQHTAMPAIVTAYNPITQRADCQPVNKHPVFNADGVKSYETLPVIPNVPVQFPRGGGYCLIFPVSPGDHVLLIFSEVSTSDWRSNGQSPAEPVDVRRHSMGHPIALAGFEPDTNPIADGASSANEMIFGLEGAAQQVRIGPNGIKLGAAANEHVMTAEATALLIYNVFATLCTAFIGPFTGIGLQPAIAAAIATALGAQAARAPPGLAAQTALNGTLQAGFATGLPANTTFAAWTTALAALATKTPDVSGLFPSVGAALTKAE